MRILLRAAVLLLVAPATAQAASRCGKASIAVGAGALDLSLWQDDGGTPSEHATLSVPARGGRFVMVLTYRPARGQAGSPNRVEAFAYAPWQRQVRAEEVLVVKAGGAQWRGRPWITGLRSHSGRIEAAALYPVAGEQAQADPSLIRAFAAGGKVRLARETKEGARFKDVLDLPTPRTLGQAYRSARAWAVAAMAECGPASVPPISAP